MEMFHIQKSSIEYSKAGNGNKFINSCFMLWLSFKDMKHCAPTPTVTTFTKHHLIYCLTFINSKSVKLKQKKNLYIRLWKPVVQGLQCVTIWQCEKKSHIYTLKWKRL